MHRVYVLYSVVFCFKQKPAYEMRISDWSSDVCSSDLRMEHTPFGSGRPYSRGQRTALLRETNFTPAASTEALFFPPSKMRTVLRFRNVFERDRKSVLSGKSV